MAGERIGEARRLGVEIAFGSDLYVAFGVPRGEAVRLALGALVEGGMTPAQALRAATWSAGRLIAPGKLGVIAPGANADLIAVAGDPTVDLASLAAIRCVLIGGRIPRAGVGCAGRTLPE